MKEQITKILINHCDTFDMYYGNGAALKLIRDLEGLIIDEANKLTQIALNNSDKVTKKLIQDK